MVSEAAVRLALAEIPDPELPMISIVDLGMVGPVTVGPTIPGRAAPDLRRLPGS